MNFTAMSSFSSMDNKQQEKCPVCGKMFKAAPEHAYHIGKSKKRRVCTYGCMRKWEKEKTERTYKPKPKAKQALPFENTIGGKIKALRRARGLTQAQLAEKSQIVKNSISRYERNENKPQAKNLEAIAEALGVSVDYFGEAQTNEM